MLFRFSALSGRGGGFFGHCRISSGGFFFLAPYNHDSESENKEEKAYNFFHGRLLFIVDNKEPVVL